jgi:hypothetical protein
MFCPKCGGQNPDSGKFCRSCGTDLGNVSQALTGNPIAPAQLIDRKGKPISWERAITKTFSGIAFIVVACALGFSRSGQDWWFWLLIPGFMGLGAGVAQLVQLRKAEKGIFIHPASSQSLPPTQNTALPPQQTEWVAPESRYKTGDLIPPSVTENTTRHLEVDSEGQTMTLPRK